MTIYSARVDGHHICYVETPDGSTQEQRNVIRKALGHKHKVPTHYWRLHPVPYKAKPFICFKPEDLI